MTFLACCTSWYFLSKYLCCVNIVYISIPDESFSSLISPLCVGVWVHACMSGYLYDCLCATWPASLHALCLPLSVSLSSCMQAFPALAQVQALRRVNECLLAENRAMLRVLARLSETASMPETEDL